MGTIVEKADILSYSVDQGTSRQNTDFFIVKTDDGSSLTAFLACHASGLPNFGDTNYDDSIQHFLKKRAQCQDNANRSVWLVQVDWDSNATTTANPLSLPAAIEWSFDNGTEPYFFDYGALYPGATDANGDPITSDQTVTTSAGEVFQNQPERESGTWSATWTKNVTPTTSIAMEIDKMQCINESAFTFDGQSIAQYAAKISGGSLSPVQVSNGVSYRVLTYKLKFKSGGWIDNIADYGFMEDDGDGNLVDIWADSKNKKKTETRWPLDGNGNAQEDNSDDPAKLPFYPYIPTNFSVFGFA